MVYPPLSSNIYYQIYAKTSPPTFSFLAALSVIIPFDVDIIAIPRPFKTLGKSSTFAYILRPGLLILFKPCKTFELFTLPTNGTVYSFTIIRVAPPEYVDFAPYTVALIQLTENLRITAFIQEAVSIGEKVRWKETKNQTFIFEKAV